jgi:LPXTG-motif cell wall-anchored protein
MDLRARRALLPAVLAAALLMLLGWHAVPARAASVDPELVAESVSEDGYYVDSGASYLKSDADLDKLREAIENAGRAGVVVLPAGTSSAPVISRLLHEPNRTYVVLTGNRLQAVSNSLPSAKVNGLLAKARQAGTPRSEVLTFLNLMSGRHVTAPTARTKAGARPSAAPSEDTVTDEPSSAPVAAAKKDSGGDGTLFGIVGVVIVLLLGGGGLLFWRRKRKSSDDPGPGPDPGQGPGPGPGPDPGHSQGPGPGPDPGRGPNAF